MLSYQFKETEKHKEIRQYPFLQLKAARPAFLSKQRIELEVPSSIEFHNEFSNYVYYAWSLFAINNDCQFFVAVAG